MENTVRLKDPKQLKFKFDLKGSSVDRVVTGRTNKHTILKDENFLIAKRTFPELTKLDSATRKRLVQVMNKDVEFLQGLGLMDYSLLIAIEKCTRSKRELHMELFNDIELNEGFLIESRDASLPSGSIKDSKHRPTVGKKAVGEWMSERHRFQYLKKILHISIIDYLQEWNLNKKAERAYKTILLRKDPVGLSAVEPETYARRFRLFAASNVFENC